MAIRFPETTSIVDRQNSRLHGTLLRRNTASGAANFSSDRSELSRQPASRSLRPLRSIKNDRGTGGCIGKYRRAMPCCSSEAQFNPYRRARLGPVRCGQVILREHFQETRILQGGGNGARETCGVGGGDDDCDGHTSRGASARRHLSRHHDLRQAAVHQRQDARGHRGHDHRRHCALLPRGAAEQGRRRGRDGTGHRNGRRVQKIDLQGSWKSGSRTYEAKYSGSFVRRSAKLKGTQTWSDGGKTVTRACTGAIKRPLKPFLPRNKKQA